MNDKIGCVSKIIIFANALAIFILFGMLLLADIISLDRNTALVGFAFGLTADFVISFAEAIERGADRG